MHMTYEMQSVYIPLEWFECHDSHLPNFEPHSSGRDAYAYAMFYAIFCKHWFRRR